MTPKPESNSQRFSRRTIGILKGKLEVPKDFDAPLPEDVQTAFEGTAAGEKSSTWSDGDESVPSSTSKSTWNYRVISFRHGEDAWCAIHEVYYENDVPKGCSREPAVVMWDPEEGDGAGSRVLDRMLEALGKPILSEEDFRRAR